MTTPVAPPTPRPHQQDALEAVESMYRQGMSRCQLRMACGSGKTLLGPWLARRLNARTVAVFAPSIGLVSQTLRSWQRSGVPMRAIAVCSDPTTAAGRAEIGIDGIDPYRGQHNVAGVVSTDAGTVAQILDRSDSPDAELTVVVSTYHSAPVIAEALRLADHCHRLDLIVADEAHHLAGRTNDLFVPVLRDAAIPARRRLFQTATPVVVAGGTARSAVDELSGAAANTHCMDDQTVFGPVAYTLSVGDAIAAGLLADYRVVVTTPRQGEQPCPERAALGALSDVVARYGVRRILTFHSRVAAARDFARRVTELGSIDGVAIKGFAVDGSMPDDARAAVLAELASDESHRVTVVSSAQCLREGIDVPAVDAVVFADPRTSPVGIIQAIGRALRTHPGKKVGSIVVPLVLDPDHDDQEQLADSAYRHIWRVLRGLRAHDARVGFDLDRARRHTGAAGMADPDDLGWLSILDDEPGAVLTRLLARSSATWEHYYGQLAAVAAERGSAAMVTAEDQLGQWIVLQRGLFRDNTLDEQRARRLEELPGWRWEAAEAADERTLARLAAVAEKHGSVAERCSGTSIYAGYTDGLNRPLRLWVATKLFAYHDGVLDEWLRAALEELPGWDWSPLDGEDTTGVAAYRSFVQWEGHTDIPADHVEDDVEVGRWLRGVRRRKALGVLPPLLEAMLLAAAPTTRGKGERAFAWNPGQTRWELGIDAIGIHLERTGTLADVAVGQRELVDGHPVNLYQWMVRVRRRYHLHQLTGDQITEVEAFPGWAWQIRGRRHVAVAEPKPGVSDHSRRGYYAGCRCLVCVTDNRTYQREARRRSKAAYRADWVDARDVRTHLQSLLALDDGKDRADATFTPGAIAAAAGVPTRRISELLRDDAPRCHPMHRRILLATTAADVQAVRTQQRSRGRKGIVRGRVADPESTWARVDALLDAGWTPQQLAAALGYSHSSKVPLRGRPVTTEKAKIVALFVDTLDGDTSPPTPPVRKRPGPTPGAPKTDPPDSDAIRWARSLLAQDYQIARVAERSGLPVDVVASIAAVDIGAHDRGRCGVPA